MYHSRILGGAGPVVRQWQRREQISDATLQRHGAWQHFNVLRFELGFVRLQCKAIHYIILGLKVRGQATFFI